MKRATKPTAKKNKAATAAQKQAAVKKQAAAKKRGAAKRRAAAKRKVAAKRRAVAKRERAAREANIGTRYRTLRSSLTERARRLFVASEAIAFGYGGIVAAARATGMAPSVIGNGIAEVHAIESGTALSL